MFRSLVAVVLVMVAALAAPQVAAANTGGRAPAGGASTSAATIDHITELSDRRVAVFVKSPAMQSIVQVQVLLPKNRAATRPTLYMLDGVSAGSETNYTESTWTFRTDAEAFLSDKNANIVLPIGGRGSYYTDWQRPDPAFGIVQWETFLTSELPPLIDKQFNGNGTNAILGLSMGAQSAVNLVVRHPSLYTGVAGYSGCYSNGPTVDRLAVRGGVISQGGDPNNMWGADDNPAWAANDPSLHIDALRGKQIYLSSGNGVPGPYDVGIEAVYSVPIGGPLESAAGECTKRFTDKLAAANIPATVNLRPFGTHAWKYWGDELKASWPTLARAMKIA